MSIDHNMERDCHNTIEIISFFEKNSEEPFIQNLYLEWTKMLDDVLGIDNGSIQKIRQHLSTWFINCYHARNDIHGLHEVSENMATIKARKLYDSFVEQMKKLVQEEIKINKIALEGVMKDINNMYSPKEWVEKAIECIEGEINLMQKYRMVFQDTKQIAEDQHLDSNVKTAYSNRLDIQRNIKQLKSVIDNLRKCINNSSTTEKLLHDLNEVLKSEQKKGKNGSVTQAKGKELMEALKNNRTEIEKYCNKVQQLNKEILEQFCRLEIHLETVITTLNGAVQKWKENFKLNFVELAPMPIVDRIENWCAQIGKLLDEILKEDLPTLNNIFNDELHMQVICDMPHECNQLCNNFTCLLQDLFQSTFVVTEQESCIIKKDKKYLPKIVLRILAAGWLAPLRAEISPMFLCEDDINACCDDNRDPDFDKMRDKNKKFGKDVKVSFTTGKKDINRKFEACFQHLIYDKKIERTTGKAVHEEKYRIMFQTSFYDKTYWTMSLPLVLTTGANQGCMSQGSVLWQCFGTDVYKLPIVTRDELSWKEVADMLNKKILYLCPSSGLTAENINHLKRRLLGTAEKLEDEIVSLKKFCYVGMVKPNSAESQDVLEFSFWKWFVGIYNLIEKYLRVYWNDKLIYGFISKEDARKILSKCSKSGTFILRFSDSHMLQSQGYKSMFGCLTACLMVIKEDKCTGEYTKMFHDMEVAGSRTLEKHNLASILRETRTDTDKNLYMYLYPGDKTRKELFDKYCEKATVMDGYTGSREAFVVDLEQQMCKLQIRTGKHHSPSQDSVFEGGSPQPVQQPAAGVKKQRCSITNDHPTIATMLSRSPKYQQDLLVTPQQSPAPSNPASLSYLHPSPTSFASSPVQSRFVPVALPLGTVPLTVTELSQEASCFSNVKNISKKSRGLSTETAKQKTRKMQWNNGSQKTGAISIQSSQGKVNDVDDLANHNIYRDSQQKMKITSMETDHSPAFTTTASRLPEFSQNIITAGAVSSCQLTSPSYCHQTFGPCDYQNSCDDTVVFVENNKQNIVIKDMYPLSLDHNLDQNAPVTYDHDQFTASTCISDQYDVQLMQTPHATPMNEQLQLLCQYLNQFEPAVRQQVLSQLLGSATLIILNEPTQVTVNHQHQQAMTSSGSQLSSGDGLITTSSGSMSDAFNFSTNEIAEVQEMNSGTIEPEVFDAVL